MNYIYIFLAVTLVLAYFISKRMGKTGCVGYGYIALVVGSVNMFTVGIVFLISTVVYDICVLPFGINYTAKVIDSVETMETFEDEDGFEYDQVMYSPIVTFTTESGQEIIKKLTFSSGSLDESYRINYNEETEKLVVLGFILVLKIVGTILFSVIFIFAFVGVVIYAFGRDMEGYYEILSTVLMKFFLPFIITTFDALLIYALFYGNEVPLWVSIFLVISIIALTSVVWVLIKPYLIEEVK